MENANASAVSASRADNIVATRVSPTPHVGPLRGREATVCDVYTKGGLRTAR
jgi:hypothetical protein